MGKYIRNKWMIVVGEVVKGTCGGENCHDEVVKLKTKQDSEGETGRVSRGGSWQ